MLCFTCLKNHNLEERDQKKEDNLPTKVSQTDISLNSLTQNSLSTPYCCSNVLVNTDFFHQKNSSNQTYHK